MTPPATRPPILVYCQHLVGLGHAQRAARLVRALVRAGEPVLYVAGGPPVPGLDLAGTETVALPPLTAADDAATRLARPDGSVADPPYLAERRARLLALLASRDPAVVVLELFPFGRHGLAFELGPLLLALADDRAWRGGRAPRVVVSLRDIVVTKQNPAWSELSVLAVLLQWTDRVLVHGSPEVIPLSASFTLADRLGERLIYTGYLGAGDLAAEPGSGPVGDGAGEVVVSGGGGRVAGPLFEAALKARQRCRAAGAVPWRLITGPYLPATTRAALAAEVAGLAPLRDRPAVVIETFRSDFPALLRSAALSVSQAGYNTVLDILQSGVRALVVPFEGTGDEQPLRARLLAGRGLLRVLPEPALSASALAAAVDAALTDQGFPTRARLDLEGAARSATVLAGLAAEVAVARCAP